MSIVSLQFGQCGNQIGNTVYSILNEDISTKNISKSNYDCKAINKWFDINSNGKWEPRSVLIDTESKAVQSLKPLPFKFKNIVAASYGGSANNWAYGYTKRGKLLKNDVLNAVRSEVEKSDYLTSFLNIFSSSGGTGSGVGSFILEELRDIYPNKNIVNAIVLPYIKGEIVTQSYNSLLSLVHLYTFTDSTILFENERLHNICKYSLNVDDIHFSTLNSVIAQQLTAVYQPLNIDTVSLLNHLMFHSSYKYLQITSEPHFVKENAKFESSRQWKALITATSKHMRFDFAHQKEVKVKNKVISRAIITRGGNMCHDTDLKPLKDNVSYVSWLPKDDSINVYHQPRNFLNFDKYLAMVTNSNSVCAPLNSILEDAWNLFIHGAYLHHYKNYDIDEDFFLNSFQVLENIFHDYLNL